jgi:hypothetical protein
VEEGRAVGVKLRDGRVRCHLAAPISCIWHESFWIV